MLRRKGAAVTKKKNGFLLVLLLVTLFFLPSLSRADGEIRGYVRGEGWQYLQMGEYPYERDGTVRPVLWRILAVDDEKILALTEYVIDTKQIIFETDQEIIKKHAYRRISEYKESDLYPWLNTEGLDRLFGEDPLRLALLEEPGRGLLYPMTRAELSEKEICLAYGFRNGLWGEELNAYPDRQGVATPWALANGLHRERNGKSSYWCVVIKNPADYKFGLVGYNGHISWGAYTNGKVGGLRLSVRLDRSMVSVTQGSGTKKDPFLLAYTGPMPDGADGGDTGISEPAASEPGSEPARAASEPGSEPAQAVAEPDIDTVEPAASETDEPGSEPAEQATSLSEETAPLSGEKDESERAEGLTEERGGESGSVSGDRAEGTALISLIGDCSIGDAYSRLSAEDSYHAVVAREGYAWPFSLVAGYLSEDDLTVANLEVVLTRRNKHKDIVYPLRGLPEHVNILTEGSIEVVNTVNNHCNDYYREGYLESLATLEEAGIAHFGSIDYKKETGFDHLLVRDVNGIRFGFAGISYPQDSDWNPLIERIGRLKNGEGCEIVIISLHWGRETHTTPEVGQLKLAKALIDAGADVIYGHHPHVLQPLVFYNGKPILFSTGNFTFGTMSRVDPHTGIFRLTYRKTGEGVALTELRVIPCQTSGKNDYRPFELTEEAERQETFRLLMLKKPYAACENPPDSFLKTGIIRLDEEGNILPETNTAEMEEQYE